MNRATVRRLAAVVADLRARKLGEAAAPLAAKALTAAGFRVHCCWDGGLSVDAAPGLREALDDLEAKAIKPPIVVIIRNLATEESANGSRDAVGADGDRAAGGNDSGGPATLAGERTSYPTTDRRTHVEE